jgi:phage shock protein A
MTEIVPPSPSEQPVVQAEPTPPQSAQKPPAPEPPKERSQEELITLIQSEREGLVTAVADLRAALERLKKQKARAQKVMPLVAATGTAAGAATKVVQHRRNSNNGEPDAGTELLRFGRWSLREHDD